jgi:signal-transduction protein with cAMP-binding, CBS, and nucleotidyltransferase domain
MASNSGDLASHPPVVCRSQDSVASVARVMVAHDVGCVVVVDEDERPIGIVTDRDLAVRVLARGLPGATEVASVMTHGVATVAQSASPMVAARQMALRGCRRLPVVSDAYGHVVGVVSADDLLREDSEELDAIARTTSVVRH